MAQKKRRILSIFGTRPEVIKLFPVLAGINKDASLESVVVSTSQHREMIDDLFELFKLTPDHDLNIIREKQFLANISTLAVSGLDPLLKSHKPDLVLVQGDTTTAFSGALVAFYNQIPVGHVEAGLRSFNKKHPYPEEGNRKLISAIADFHFAPTDHNAKHLIEEGVVPGNIFVTGNTVIDSLLYSVSSNSNTLSEYLPCEIWESCRMILVTSHRRENWGRPLENLCRALVDLTHSYPDIQIVYPVHLNPAVRETVNKILSRRKRIHLLEPLTYKTFVEAMSRSHLIITDSGGIQEEGPSLQKPILVFRKVTERPEGLSTGGVKLVGLEREDIVQETSRLLEDDDAYRAMTANYNPYGDGRAAERIIQAIKYYFGLAERPEDFRPGVSTSLSQQALPN
ncbi:MAG: UDP-N-acetylglucosamine 2-epimerase [Gammaproteobacteria bacterium SG8_11]|nr:MAG: UDP-N-acetylglucosamine 2-epimerase [Gammaproteobacteria bacterium SG8_11]